MCLLGFGYQIRKSKFNAIYLTDLSQENPSVGKGRTKSERIDSCQKFTSRQICSMQWKYRQKSKQKSDLVLSKEPWKFAYMTHLKNIQVKYYLQEKISKTVFNYVNNSDSLEI